METWPQILSLRIDDSLQFFNRDYLCESVLRQTTDKPQVQQVILQCHGINAVDYSGYPDCRPEFINAFEIMANLATRAGVEGNRLRIHAPLIDLSKADIIRRGHALGVDYALTVSCYQADDDGRACGVCDACRLRQDGFAAANVADPTPYAV